jgi:hypothetical protein
MEDLTFIANVDDILDAVAGTKIITEPCTSLFYEQKDLRAEMPEFIKKESASDTDVILSKFLITKGYKKYKVGLAVKMWLNWQDVTEADKKNVDIEYSKRQKYIKAILQERDEMIKVVGYKDVEKMKSKVNGLKKTVNALKFDLDVLKSKDSLTHKDKILKKQLEYQDLYKKLIAMQEIISIDSVQFDENLRALSRASMEIDMKTGFEMLATYKGLKYEKCVYEFITKNIIQKNISPNFIPLLAYKSCLLGDILPQLPFPENHERYKLLKELVNLLPDLCLQFIITGTGLEKAKFQPLEDQMRFFDDNDEEFPPVLFQAIYSLAVMEMFGIVHNDLHLGNIFVHELDQPMILTFEINEKIIHIKTRYILKFYDWDRAYIKQLGDNKFLSELDYPVSNHQVNSSRTKQDLYQFLCGLSEYRDVWDVVNSLIPNIPRKREFYFFNVRRNVNYTVIIENSIEIKKYIQMNFKKKKYFIDSQKRFWIEFDTNLLQSFQQGREIIKAFVKIYPEKNIANYSYIYFGLQFLDDKDFPTLVFNNSDKVKIYFSTGHFCQSLFDVKDEVLYSAKQYLFSSAFLNKFKYVPSASTTMERRTYVFPTYSFPNTPIPCNFEGCQKL